MTGPVPHIPVLRDEVIAALAPIGGRRYIDATFGAGGYTAAILAAANCSVTAFDRDPDAISAGQAMAADWDGRLTLVHARFGEMTACVQASPDSQIDGVAFDLGVSSMQIDESNRGFSFRHDGPLDMRMSKDGNSAADLVNSASESELADIIYLYGEERHSRRLAREIVAVREAAPLTTTRQLAELVRRVVPGKRGEIDPATRTFQALRIAVNDELGQLEQGLKAAEALLAPGGRLVVVTFHSLEDRIVKSFLRERSGEAVGPSRHQPKASDHRRPSFVLATRKPVAPGEAEIAANPRARSAKLRAAIRTDAPVYEAAA